MWFIGVEVEQETSAPLLKKNPGSAPVKNEEYTSHVTIYLRTTASAGAMLKTTPTADHKLFQTKVSTT